VVARQKEVLSMATRGISPGRYNPSLVPQRISDTYGSSYSRETGVLTSDGEYDEYGEQYQQPMDEDEFRYVVAQAIEDAGTYIDSYLAPERERAMAYYLAEPFGDEEEGRSQVILTEVRDTVLAMLPSLLRIFTSGDKILEFIPSGPEDIDAAEQATDLINYIFMQENNGFRVLHDAMKDALILKTGVLTWNKFDDVSLEYYSYSGISSDEANFILSEPGIELEELVEELDNITGGTIVSLRVVKRKTKVRYVIECIPPEQFLIDNEATNLDDAIYIGRRKLATVSELVAMGYDQQIIEENAGTGGFEMNGEVITRNPADQSFFGISGGNDESTDKVFYVESYIRVDTNGDGIAELHKVCSIGNGTYILHDEIVQEAPFAILAPDPTPHTIFGQSIADLTMDLQLIKSAIMRNTLDSLAQSIHPRTVIIEGQVNIDDVMNVETGAIIRARSAGAVQALSEPFVGQAALGVMAYLDEIKTQRTGVSRASQGLDADALQSTTSAAVQAQLSSSQERIEMIARLFADGLKRCFKGVLKMVVQHQDKPKIIRLRNKFVPIDPRAWDSSMDMIVNIALGRGSDAQRAGFLMQILGLQKEAIQTYGPNNPLVSIEQLRGTLADMTKLAGYMDPAKFWKEVTPETVDSFMKQQQEQAQSKPDPAQMLADVESQKTKADILINAAKQELERQKAAASADFDRDKLYIDSILKAAEMQAKYGAQVDMAVIKGEVDRQRTEIQEMFKTAQVQQQQPMGPI